MFGLPMKKKRLAFIDTVTRQCVFYYVDTKGREWMASGKWDLFGRVRST